MGGFLQRAISRFQKPRVALALSGGGCKAFFALGAGKVLIEGGAPVSIVSGTSAGAAMAMAVIAGLGDDIVNYFVQITRRNKANFYWTWLLRGKRPFPHERMYRSALAAYMDLDRLRSSPIGLRVNALLMPPELYVASGRWRLYRLIADIVAGYRKEMALARQGIYRNILREISQRAGLIEKVFTEQDLYSPARAENIVMASSSAPPIVRVQRLDDGHFYLDGGIFNNLPVSILPPATLTVAVFYEELARKQLEAQGDHLGRQMIYIAPGRPLPITSFDYANPEGVRQTYEMGLRAGERALREIHSRLAG
ncbi:MAG: patatin-like phospholipase family protein [Leptospirales bacterium]|nr:patatin-like phospholipase family protein [Leptospirales bacterium]